MSSQQSGVEQSKEQQQASAYADKLAAKGHEVQADVKERFSGEPDFLSSQFKADSASNTGDLSEDFAEPTKALFQALTHEGQAMTADTQRQSGGSWFGSGSWFGGSSSSSSDGGAVDSAKASGSSLSAKAHEALADVKEHMSGSGEAAEAKAHQAKANVTPSTGESLVEGTKAKYHELRGEGQAKAEKWKEEGRAARDEAEARAHQGAAEAQRERGGSWMSGNSNDRGSSWLGERSSENAGIVESIKAVGSSIAAKGHEMMAGVKETMWGSGETAEAKAHQAKADVTPSTVESIKESAKAKYHGLKGEGEAQLGKWEEQGQAAKDRADAESHRASARVEE